jgi:hypothetical protein
MALLKTALLSTLWCLGFNSFCNAETISPNLADVGKTQDWVIHQRTPTIVDDHKQPLLSFDEQPEAGIAWLKTVDMSDGVIEVDLKGRDVKDKSYLGVAFRGIDAKTYQAVYFRPFNFKAVDPVRKSHAIQYIAEPAYPWEKLRQDFPGKYENFVSPLPDPNGFFHVKIVLEQAHIRVYLNNATEATLAVDSLVPQKSGWVGLWVGKNADGQFKNLSITAANP